MVDLIEYWLFENLSDEAADALERKLYEPPPTVSPEILADDPMWSAEAEMEGLLKMMG